MAICFAAMASAVAMAFAVGWKPLVLVRVSGDTITEVAGEESTDDG